MTRPPLPPGRPPPAPPGSPSRTFACEVRRAVAYERGLALKALFCVAVIALIITAEVLWS